MRVLSFDPGGNVRGRLVVTVRDSGCWHFAGSRNKQGYGKFKFQGKLVHAHRAMYCIANKLNIQDIDNILIRHRCDNPPCCNPQHLEKGTYQDNADDRESRGRAVYLPGESNGQSKITEQDVRDIREATGTLRQIGDKYGLHLSTIHLIKARKKWKHIV